LKGEKKKSWGRVHPKKLEERDEGLERGKEKPDWAGTYDKESQSKKKGRKEKDSKRQRMTYSGGEGGRGISQEGTEKRWDQIGRGGEATGNVLV